MRIAMAGAAYEQNIVAGIPLEPEVARSSILEQIRDNVVLRVVIYYVLLFSAAAVLWRTPWARHLVRGSLDALRTGESAISLRGAAARAAVDTVDETTFAFTVGAAM